MAGPTCKTMERHISQQPEQSKATKKSNRNLSPCLFVLDGGGDSISRHGYLAGGNGRIYPVRAYYLPHTPALTTGGFGVMTIGIRFGDPRRATAPVSPACRLLNALGPLRRLPLDLSVHAPPTDFQSAAASLQNAG